MAEGPKGLGDYSPRNQLAILAQRGDATQLAGYRQWQGFGRQVRKGEHGIRIAAPVTEKTDDGRKMVNVRGATVFDIAQTDKVDQ
jgi:hypothetical protein